MLEKPSTLPVALPWASCVWNTSEGLGWRSRGAGCAAFGAAGSAPISLDRSLDMAFFLPGSPSGIVAARRARPAGKGPHGASGVLPGREEARTLRDRRRAAASSLLFSKRNLPDFNRSLNGTDPIRSYGIALVPPGRAQRDLPASKWGGSGRFPSDPEL
uniref:Uncharacterized protein n=1 Tax=Sarcophilus harrisii TaxID=9305 RepID=A0A7N4PDD9_SARHA